MTVSDLKDMKEKELNNGRLASESYSIRVHSTGVACNALSSIVLSTTTYLLGRPYYHL